MRQPPPKQPSPRRLQTAAPRLHGLPPLVSEHTTVLVLGSFPGGRSLQLRQYYAHPQNHFWPIMQSLWPDAWAQAQRHADLADYDVRCNWLLSRGVGLWDVYESCLREGSLDANIRDAQLNDFAGLAARLPRLRAIAHNGGESFRHARRLRQALPDERIAIHRLPSSSPANASWSFARKQQAWREVLALHGLVA
ncbi:MAG: DNA-deoxyinosine glycosylase [Betaproteobacteria bacterium]|nr:DNA-deoxyinosine glycosylase [Betaproteobacteria bacterium]